MNPKKTDPQRSKKARQQHEKGEKGAGKSESQERQQARENQSAGRGSGEGKSGLQRGDGHPTGR